MGEIYLFLGKELYSIDDKIKRKIAEHKIDEFNINIYDLEEVNLSEAMRDALTPPFMGEMKAILLKNPFFLSTIKPTIDHKLYSFQEYLKNPMDTTILLINAANLQLDEKKDIVKKLKRAANISYNNPLTEVEFKAWFTRYLKFAGVEMQRDADKAFFNLAGKSVINAKNEADKLISYVGPGGTITTAIINKVVVKDIEDDVYALTNAIIEKNRSKVISIYQDLIKGGRDVMYLFSLVVKSMRETLLTHLYLEEGLSAEDINKKFSYYNQYKISYMIKNTKALDYDIVCKYIHKLSELDYKIKSGQIEGKTGFELLLFEF